MFLSGKLKHEIKIDEIRGDEMKIDDMKIDGRRREKRVHFQMHNQRPTSDTGPMFRHTAITEAPKEYIMITDDILDEFKSHVLTSHKVNINFNSSITFVKRGQCKLPPIYKERLRRLHEKAVQRVNERNARALGDLSHSDSVRSMDSGEELGDLPDDVIDTVAKANSVPTEPSTVLPEIRASPCQIHTKRIRGKGQEALYSTNSHMKEVNSPRKWNPNPIKKITIQHTSSQGQDKLRTANNNNNTNSKFDLDVRIPTHQATSTKALTLPKQLSSKDYVMTWLIHGSAPTGSNHFPNIVQNGKKEGQHVQRHRKTDISE